MEMCMKMTCTPFSSNSYIFWETGNAWGNCTRTDRLKKTVGGADGRGMCFSESAKRIKRKSENGSVYVQTTKASPLNRVLKGQNMNNPMRSVGQADNVASAALKGLNVKMLKLFNPFRAASASRSLFPCVSHTVIQIKPLSGFLNSFLDYQTQCLDS